MKNSKIFLFGHKGLLGSAIAKTISESDIVLIGRNETLDKSPLTISNNILKSLGPQDSAYIIFASGITDPNKNHNEIFYSNFNLPLETILSTHENKNIKYICFGSIQEHFAGLCKNNSYLQSKYELGKKITELNNSFLNGRALYLRLHTLYGDIFPPHMFLGQILNSLKTNRTFAMSHGQQLREYHHAEDIAQTVVSVVANDISSNLAIDINHGSAIKLGFLAKKIFKHFNKENLLSIGDIHADSSENKDVVFPRSSDVLLPCSREPVTGILQCLTKNLTK